MKKGAVRRTRTDAPRGPRNIAPRRQGQHLPQHREAAEVLERSVGFCLPACQESEPVNYSRQ